MSILLRSAARWARLSGVRAMHTARPLLANKPSDFDTMMSKSIEEEIKEIQKNESNYFGNVKKSFDNLQASRRLETLEEKRSRLKYQSRKRGTLENGLLLSNFAHQHLPAMNEDELNEYDKIINSLHNEWDLYYWLTNTVPIPEEIEALAVMQKMKKYCMNEQRLSRIVQP